jgi:GH15 family glucan-1,4-alpha-glucosidase
VAGWQSWTRIHQGYQGPYREQVMLSGRVLQALTYRPTGAVVAAATTSLPEKVGGPANWDYRFGWLRDGSFTLKALWVAACPDEGQRFFDWIAASTGPIGDGRVPVMFGAGGEHDLTEHRLDHLAGYADSRPVRVGNNAWNQKQLDVLGEVLECAWVLRDQLGELTPPTAAFLRSLADRAAATWREPDAGIWEGREGERDYLTSKVMCWVALDRAIDLADRLGAEADVARWKAEREQVRAAILDRGWNESVQAFTGAFGSDHLDAGVLLLPIVGFLPGDDERVVAILDAIERELSSDALMQRWTGSGDARSSSARTGWPPPARWPGRSTARNRSSRRSPATPTTSGYCPRRSTCATARWSATSRRPCRTSAWSTPPGPSPEPGSRTCRTRHSRNAHTEISSDDHGPCAGAPIASSSGSGAPVGV